jgi:hypothetical protein
VTGPGRVDVQSSVPGGGALSLTGRVQPPPAASQLRLTVRSVDLAPWAHLVPVAARIAGVAEGDLRIDEPLAPGVPNHIAGIIAVKRLSVGDGRRTLVDVDRTVMQPKITVVTQPGRANSVITVRDGATVLGKGVLGVDQSGRATTSFLLPRAPHGKPYANLAVTLNGAAFETINIPYADRLAAIAALQAKREVVKQAFRLDQPWDTMADAPAVLETLVSYHADVNARDDDDETPLHYAAWYGSLPIAEFLLAHGAELNARTGNAQTPLHYAAGWGQQGVAALLLSRGAELNARDKDGVTPLAMALREGRTDVADFLLGAGGEE